MRSCFVLLPLLAHNIFVQGFDRLPHSSQQLRHSDPPARPQHPTSSSLAFQLSVLQTTGKDFAEHQLEDTDCATDKGSLSTVTVLTCTLKFWTKALPRTSGCTTAPKDHQRCSKTRGCLQQPKREGTLDCCGFLLRLLMAFAGAWSPLKLERKAGSRKFKLWVTLMVLLQPLTYCCLWSHSSSALNCLV